MVHLGLSQTLQVPRPLLGNLRHRWAWLLVILPPEGTCVLHRGSQDLAGFNDGLGALLLIR